MKKKYSFLFKIKPLLIGFFIMGFCDVTGIATTYLKELFNLSEGVAGFIQSVTFIWFLLLTIPVILLKDRVGRKNMIQLGNIVIILGMSLPFFLQASFEIYLVTFTLLGIGSTILWVSLNSLCLDNRNVDLPKGSMMVIKIIKILCSFLGPIIAAFAAIQLGNWVYVFLIYGVLTLFFSILVFRTEVVVPPFLENNLSSFDSIVALLKDKVLLKSFVCVTLLVGVDVGMNVVTPKLMVEYSGLDAASAGIGSSVYFLCRIVGFLVGTSFFVKSKETKKFYSHILVAMVAMILLFFVFDEFLMLLLVGIIGYSCSVFFQIIYSRIIDTRPEMEQEISSLMVIPLFGGAVVPPLMGFAADWMDGQSGSLLVIFGCLCFFAYFAFGLISNDKIKNV